MNNTTAPRITAHHSTALQLGEAGAALVQHHADGALEVLRDLRTADPCDCCEDGPIVLRHPGRAWADDLVAAEREAAEERGHVPVIGTLRKLAGMEATRELAAELARETAAVVPTPRRSGRHVAAPLDLDLAQELAAWSDLLDRLLAA